MGEHRRVLGHAFEVDEIPRLGGSAQMVDQHLHRSRVPSIDQRLVPGGVRAAGPAETPSVLDERERRDEAICIEYANDVGARRGLLERADPGLDPAVCRIEARASRARQEACPFVFQIVKSLESVGDDNPDGCVGAVSERGGRALHDQ
jgi:hypothetical protein